MKHRFIHFISILFLPAALAFGQTEAQFCIETDFTPQASHTDGRITVTVEQRLIKTWDVSSLPIGIPQNFTIHMPIPWEELTSYGETVERINPLSRLSLSPHLTIDPEVERQFPAGIPDILEPDDSLEINPEKRTKVAATLWKKLLSLMNKLSELQKDSHPLVGYFQSVFPIPKTIRLKSDENKDAKEGSISVEFHSHTWQRTFQTLPQFPATSRWCFPTHEGTNGKTIESTILKNLTLPELSPLTPPDEQKSLPTESPQKPPHWSQTFRYPGLLRRSEWKPLWATLLLAQLYEAVFLHTPESVFAEYAAVAPPDFMASLMQELTKIPKSPSETPHPIQELWQALQSWVNAHLMLIHQPVTEYRIAKAFDGVGSQGTLMRSYAEFGQKRGDTFGPAIILPHALVTLAIIGEDASMVTPHPVVGWPTLSSFVRHGIAHLWHHFVQKTKTEVSPTKSEPISIPYPTPSEDPDIWTRLLPAWRTDDLLSDIRKAHHTPAVWLKGNRWHTLHKAIEALSENNPDAWEHTWVAHITPAHSQMHITFEHLGQLAKSQTPLGSASVISFPEWLRTQNITPEHVGKKMRSPLPATLSLETLFHMLQPEPLFSLGPISLVHRTYASDSPYHVETHLAQDRATVVITPPKGRDHPISIPLPSSCTLLISEYEGMQIPSMRLPSAVLAKDITWEDGSQHMLVVIACGTGEILLRMDGQPLSCGEENLSWHLHQALFAHESHPLFPLPFVRMVRAVATPGDASRYKLQSYGASQIRTPETFQGFVRNLLCHTDHSWHTTRTEMRRTYPQEETDTERMTPISVPTFHTIHRVTLEQFSKYGVSAITHIKWISGMGLHEHLGMLVLGLQDGTFYPIYLKHLRNEKDQLFWQMTIPPHPQSYLIGEPVHFRNDLNPYANKTAYLHPPALGKPMDIVFSRPISIPAIAATLPTSPSEPPQLVASELATAPTPEHMTHMMHAALKHPWCQSQTAVVAFALLSGGSTLGEQRHFLTKWVWFPFEHFGPPPDDTSRSLAAACMRTVQNLLGHGQVIPLHQRSAERILSWSSATSSTSFIDPIVVDGTPDGTITVFDTRHLHPLPPKPEPNRTLSAWWGDWAAGLLRFLPSDYVYFTPAQTQLYHHTMHPTCVGIPQLPNPLMQLSQLTMDACRMWTAKDSQDKGKGAPKYWMPFVHHTYTSSDDTHVLMHSGSEYFRNISVASNKAFFSDTHLPFSPISLPSGKKEVMQNFAALFDPIHNQENLVHFLATTTSELPKGLSDITSLKETLTSMLSNPERKAALDSDAEASLRHKLHQYFCSFLTISYGSDHLKVIPGASDLPTYSHFTDVFRDHAKWITSPQTFGCYTWQKGSKNPEGETNSITWPASVLQLKVSALDEWQPDFPTAVDSRIENHRISLIKIMEYFSASSEGKVALHLFKQLRNPLIIPSFAQTLGYVNLTPPKASLPALLDDLPAPAIPLSERVTQLLEQNSFWKILSKWTDAYPNASHLPWIHRTLTFFLTEFLAQTMFYTEQFAPAVAHVYRTLFPNVDIPTSQNELLNAVQFKAITSDIREKLIKNLTPNLLVPEGILDKTALTQAWNQIWMCSVDVDNHFALSCGRDAQAKPTLSVTSTDFLLAFLEHSLQIPSRLAVPSEKTPQAISEYIKKYIRQTYILGILNPANPTELIPVTVAFFHARPGLATQTEQQEFYSVEASGERGNLGNMFFPHFYFPQSFLYQRTVENRKAIYKLPHTLENWPMVIKSEWNAWNVTGDGNIASKPFAPSAPSLLKTAIGFLSTPYKSSEYMVIKDNPPQCGTTDLNLLMRDHLIKLAGEMVSAEDAKGRAAKIAAFDKKFAEIKEKHCDLFATQEDALDRHTIGPVQRHKAETDTWVTDHYVLLNRMFRAPMDIAFQAYWDQWVHYPKATKKILPAVSVFDRMYQDMFGFLHGTKRPSYGITILDDMITHIIKPLYTPSDAKTLQPLSSIVGYDDALAREVMFPMLQRYVEFPKYQYEFDNLEGAKLACQQKAGMVESFENFSIASKSCIESRTKQVIAAVTKDTRHMFAFPSLRALFTDLWQSSTEKRTTNEPFLTVSPKTSAHPTVLYPNPEFFEHPDHAPHLLQAYREFTAQKVHLLTEPESRAQWMLRPKDSHFEPLSISNMLETMMSHRLFSLPAKTPTDATIPMLTLSQPLHVQHFFDPTAQPNGPTALLDDASESTPDPDALYSLLRIGRDVHHFTPNPQSLAQHRYVTGSGTWLVHDGARMGFQFPWAGADELTSALQHGAGLPLLEIAPTLAPDMRFSFPKDGEAEISGCVGMTCVHMCLTHAADGTLTKGPYHPPMLEQQELLPGQIIQFYLIPWLKKNKVRALAHIVDWMVESQDQWIAINLTLQESGASEAPISGYHAMILHAALTSENHWDLNPDPVVSMPQTRLLAPLQKNQVWHTPTLCFSALHRNDAHGTWALQKHCNVIDKQALALDQQDLVEWLKE